MSSDRGAGSRGKDTLAFGPLKPVGLIDPKTGRQPFAVIQLRQENRFGTLFNLVGFQTRLRQEEQRKVFRMIPGLEKAEFVRTGSVHRNTFIDSPRVRRVPAVQGRSNLFLPGRLPESKGIWNRPRWGYSQASMRFGSRRDEEPFSLRPPLRWGPWSIISPIPQSFLFNR